MRTALLTAAVLLGFAATASAQAGTYSGGMHPRFLAAYAAGTNDPSWDDPAFGGNAHLVLYPYTIKTRQHPAAYDIRFMWHKYFAGYNIPTPWPIP